MKKLLWIFISIFFLYLWSSRLGLDGYELEYMLSAENMINNGSFSMSTNPVNLSGALPRPPGKITLPRHNLLQVFPTIPMYIIGMPFNKRLQAIDSDFKELPIGSLFFISFLNPIFTIISIWLIIRIGVKLKFSYGASVTCGVIYGVATIAWPYAVIGMEPLQSGVLLLSFYMLIQLEKTQSFTMVSLTALVITALMHTKISAPLLALPVSIAALFLLIEKSSPGKIRKIFLYIIILSLSTMIWIFLYILRRDAMYTGSFFVNFKPFLIPRNIFAFIFSPGKSIFVFNPILLWCLPGLPIFMRRHKRIAIVMMVTGFLALILTASWDWSILEESWGPRYLMPLIAIMMIMGLSRFESHVFDHYTLKYVFVCLIIVSVLTQFPGVLYLGVNMLKTAQNDEISILDLTIWTPDLSPVYTGWHMIMNKFRRAFGLSQEPLVWHHYRDIVGQGSKPVTATFNHYHLNRVNTLPYFIEYFLLKHAGLEVPDQDTSWIFLLWMSVSGCLLVFIFYQVSMLKKFV